jgi:hypothetical protein
MAVGNQAITLSKVITVSRVITTAKDHRHIEAPGTYPSSHSFPSRLTFV